MTATCSVPQCDDALKALGMCRRHYIRHTGRTRQMTAVPCAGCGKEILRSRNRSSRPVCSIACKRLVVYGKSEPAKYSYRTYEQARRARRAGATVVEMIDPDAVYTRDNYTCYLCRTVLDPEDIGRGAPTLDHILPLSLGGQHTWDNVRTACRSCNASKGQLTPEQALAEAQPVPLGPPNRARGERAGSSRLTAIQVHEIRTRYATGLEPQTSLAEAFGVSQTLISSIVRGKTWRHLLDAS